MDRDTMLDLAVFAPFRTIYHEGAFALNIRDNLTPGQKGNGGGQYELKTDEQEGYREHVNGVEKTPLNGTVDENQELEFHVRYNDTVHWTEKGKKSGDYDEPDLEGDPRDLALLTDIRRCFSVPSVPYEFVDNLPKFEWHKAMFWYPLCRHLGLTCRGIVTLERRWPGPTVPEAFALRGPI